MRNRASRTSLEAMLSAVMEAAAMRTPVAMVTRTDVCLGRRPNRLRRRRPTRMPMRSPKYAMSPPRRMSTSTRVHPYTRQPPFRGGSDPTKSLLAAAAPDQQRDAEGGQQHVLHPRPHHGGNGAPLAQGGA